MKIDYIESENENAPFSFAKKKPPRVFDLLLFFSFLFSLGPDAEPRVPRLVLGVGHAVPHVRAALLARADLFGEQGRARDGASDEDAEEHTRLRGAELGHADF